MRSLLVLFDRAYTASASSTYSTAASKPLGRLLAVAIAVMSCRV
jgi:hypothetical protein